MSEDWPELQGKMSYPEPKPPVRIWQRPDEISQLVDLYKQLQPRYVFEIGSESGGTLWYWIQHACPDAVVANCDLMLVAAESSREGHAIWPTWAAEKGIRLVTFNMLSTNYDLRALLRQTFPAGLDFCFIDGSHSYDTALNDFNLCWSMLNPGGVIAMHDICFPHIQYANEVDTLWAEIKLRKDVRTEEFIGLPNPNGIGVIYKEG